MRFYQVATAALLGFASLTPVLAQAAPRELPPASFTGQQYVDSKGCVFLRAGYGGQVQWVPRITAARKPLCGYPPTFGAVNIEVAAPAAPAPQPQVAAPKPQPVVVAQQPAAQPVVRQPVVAAQPARVAVQPAPQVRATQPAQVAAGPGPGQIGCYKSAPVPMLVRLQGGGTTLVCTKGDGTMEGWRPAIFPNGTPPGAALNFPQVAGYQMTSGGQVMAAAAQPAIPEGYRAAWEDDRLNPQRGVGTVAGQAQQDQIWTREVPAQQVATAAPKTKTTVSSNTNSTPASGSFFVQVGTFGVPENASGAAARLSSLGLPTAKGNLTKNGKALQIVYAGPFASASAAQSALSAARAAGFSDAFIR